MKHPPTYTIEQKLKKPVEVFGQLRSELAEAAKRINAVVGGSTVNMVEDWSEFDYGYLCEFFLIIPYYLFDTIP